ncbi:MAG: tyrosine-type recombinase/integrase [Bacteroidia bacterium]
MLKQIFFQYLTAERNRSTHTVEAYRGDLESLASWLEEMHGFYLHEESSVSKIRNRHLRAWMGDLMERGYTARSVARKLSAAKSYFKFLLRRGYIDADPAQQVRSPGFDQKLPAFLKESETEKLFEGFSFPQDFEGRRDCLMMELLYGCGLRRAEIISLQWEDFDIYNRTLRVLGKRSKMRIIPFGKAVQAAAEEYKVVFQEKGLNPKGPLLQRPNGKPLYPSLVYRAVKKHLATITSQQTSPHILRHTFATHLLDHGADLNAIKDMLGHASLSATQVYTHNSIRKLKEAHAQAHPRSGDDSVSS